MRELQRKIKALDAALTKNKSDIASCYYSLNKWLHRSVFVPFGIIGGFVTGYLLARKKSFSQLIRSLVSKSTSVYKLANFLVLPFISSQPTLIPIPIKSTNKHKKR